MPGTRPLTVANLSSVSAANTAEQPLFGSPYEKWHGVTSVGDKVTESACECSCILS